MTEAPKSTGRSSSAKSGPQAGSKPRATSNDQDESQQAPWWHVDADDDAPNPADVGSAAQEAVKLAAAVAQWADQTGLTQTLKGIAEQAAVSVQTAARAATTTTAAPSDSDESAGEGTSGSHDSTTCDNCPICQGVDFIKTVSPEAASGINDALAAVTTAIRQAVDGLTPAGDGSGTKVEHIDID